VIHFQGTALRLASQRAISTLSQLIAAVPLRAKTFLEDESRNATVSLVPIGMDGCMVLSDPAVLWCRSQPRDAAVYKGVAEVLHFCLGRGPGEQSWAKNW